MTLGKHMENAGNEVRKPRVAVRDVPGEHMPRTAYAIDAAPAPASERLAGDIDAEVVVVGAGYSGLSTALHVAELGLSVVILESQEVGYGASGRNFGQVVPYLRHSGQHALSRLGAHWGERLIDSAANGAELVFSLIEKYALRCAARRGGLMFAAHNQRQIKMLEGRVGFWLNRGVNLRMLGERETSEHVGGGRFPASILEHRGGTINALSFARELARATLEKGGRLFTNSPVDSVVKRNGRWITKTNAGSVTSKWVVMCTGAYTDPKFLRLSRTFLPIRAYQFETEPLPTDFRRKVLPGVTALTDTRPMISGIRIYEDGRLHLSSDGAAFGSVDRPQNDFAIRRLKEIFPFIEDVRIRSQWAGLIDFVPDQFPKILALDEQFVAPIGFSGRGIALATMAGREIAKLIDGRSPENLNFIYARSGEIPSKLLMQAAIGSGMACFRMIDRISNLFQKNGIAG